MTISYDRTDYLYRFIPAILSIVSCTALIVSVIVQPPLRDRIYHRLSVALAITQIIMYSSWMLGNKEDAPLAVCKLQDYLFQFGQTLCAVTVTVINSYVFYVLNKASLPDEKRFRLIYAGTLLICVITLIISVSFDIASMFCGDVENSTFSSEDFDQGTKEQKIVLKSCYLYPLIGLLGVNTLFCCYSVYQMSFAVRENRFMIPLLQRLLTFTLVVIICGLPKVVSIFIFPNVSTFTNISDSIIHSSGVLSSASYFYYTVKQDKSRWQTIRLLRESLLNKSSTPDDVISDSSYNPSKNSTNISSANKSVDYTPPSNFGHDDCSYNNI